MCDYSLQAALSRPAVVGDKLTITDFGTGTRGFASADQPGVAVCCLPGSELAFDKPPQPIFGYGVPTENTHQTAVFRQVNKNQPFVHHDSLEFPDGTTLMLTNVVPGVTATVLQLPAAPKTAEEAEEQRRAEFVG